MAARSILVVAVDGLRASALGAYGNTAFATPALDKFAAESVVLDWCYTPAIELQALYGVLWQSIHPAHTELSPAAAATLPRLLAERDYRTTLVTDEPALVAMQPASDFDELIACSEASRPSPSRVTQESAARRVDDIAHTAQARLFAEVSHAVGAASPGRRLIWVHSRGFYGPWDAPLELQRLLLDEGDPPPVEDAMPPDLILTEQDDPDSAFRYACAYAAQAMVLDRCWEGLLEGLRSEADDWLVMLLGVRGMPLGEHRRVGGIDPRLYGEALHVPWLARFPDGRGRLSRVSVLTTPLDVLPTLVEWIDQWNDQAAPAAGSVVGEGLQQPASGPSEGSPRRFDGLSILPLMSCGPAHFAKPVQEHDPVAGGSTFPSSKRFSREHLISVSSAGHRAIRSAAWCLRQDAHSGTPPELYVRPDDRWEANDVAKLCPDTVEALRRAMDEGLAKRQR